MKWNAMSKVATSDDAALVAEVLNGNRDAFGQLVARYQSSVCGLAYCACGNISQSEDLAQEAFIIAWRDLGDLTEPAKFKSWLHGIARNLVNGAYRRQTRNPLSICEPLDDSLATAAPASNPTEQAISKEEEAILWRSLEQIPETYREPMVLFYREHQSIERVAAILELSEEAARQRLSRGRKLLQERVVAFVEGALEQTAPGATFTLGVLVALPVTTLPVKAATLGPAAKGGAVAKTSGLIGLFGAVLTPLIALLGMLVDYRLKKKAGLAEGMLKPLKAYYLVITFSVLIVVLGACILMNYGSALIKISPALFVALTLVVILGYPLLIATFARRFFRAMTKARPDPSIAGIMAQGNDSVLEYRSRFEWLGLPLIHIRFGECAVQPERTFTVKGWIAMSEGFSFGGLFAYGGVAIAPISIGACSMGLLSYGAMAFGAVVWGGFAFGVWAFGAFAFGWQAFSGGCAIAWHLAWGNEYAIAHDYALGAGAVHATQANTPLAEHLVRASWGCGFAMALAPYFYWLMWVWAAPIMIAIAARWVRIVKRPKSPGQSRV
jgi:RNA polymerase sigma factor (sigma-70 family)